MKIAFIIGLYPHQIGGAEMQALEISTALQKEGHSITYICYSSKTYSSNEYEVSIIPTRASWDIFYYGTKNKLYKALNEIHPDIVYHRAFVPYSRFIAKWCMSNNVPFYFHSADIYTLTRKNNSLYNILQNMWLKYTLSHSTGVICQNKEQYEALQNFKIKRLKTIYNIQRTNVKPLCTDKGHNLVWIAKFEQAKQPELFIYFAERFKNKNVTFTMFSSKMPKTEKNRKLLERILNNSQITLIEGKDNEYINDYLCNKASLLINTSVSEGISNTFIQAWMRGVPVVSLNSNPDNWFDNYMIGGCCKGDVNRMDVLVANIIFGDKYKDYAKNCIEFAEKHFSPEVVVPQLTSFMHLK